MTLRFNCVHRHFSPFKDYQVPGDLTPTHADAVVNAGIAEWVERAVETRVDVETASAPRQRKRRGRRKKNDSQ